MAKRKDLADRAIETKDRMIDRARDAKDKIVEKAHEARAKVEDMTKQAGRYIDKNPRKATAIAVAAGAVLGAILVASTRKRRRGFFD